MSTLGNLIDKVKAILSASPAQSDLLSATLMPLAALSEDLHAQAVNYVKDGTDSEVLLALTNRSDEKAWTLMGSNMGTISWNHVHISLSSKETSLRDKAYQARRTLYIDLYSHLNPTQVMRLGKLIYAIQQGKAELPKADIVPEWFWVLCCDALYNTVSRHHGRTDDDHRKKWHTDDLLSTLQADDDLDNPVATLITAMFERHGISEYYHENLELLYRMAGAKAFLQTHIDDVLRIIPMLSAGAQKLFLDHFLTYEPDVLDDFAQVVVTLSGSSSKKIRELASTKFSQLNTDVVHNYLAILINTGDNKQRTFAADMLARLGERARDTLVAALNTEQSKTVANSIEQALSRLDTADVASDDSVFVTTPIEPIPRSILPDSVIDMLRQNYYEILEDYKKRADAEIADNARLSNDYKSTWRQSEYKQWQKLESSLDKELKNILDYLNGLTSQAKSRLTECVTYKKRITSLPEFGPYQVLRLVLKGTYFSWAYAMNLISANANQLELRQLAQVGHECGIDDIDRVIANDYLRDSYHDNYITQYIQRDEQILPFFYEHPEFIEEALRLLPSKASRWYGFDPKLALGLLHRYPTIPKNLIAKLLELALGDQKRLRTDAQDVLAKLPNVHERAIEALSNGKQEIRISACQWLMRLGHKDAIKPLNALLKKEKKEVVIAAALTTLESLGQDISEYLSPKTLLADAQKGLKAKPPASLAWFDYSSLPTLYWKNGKAVNADIIRWWVILAEKLKEPAPNALLIRYLGLLDEKSADTLSMHLLGEFIRQDTLTVDVDEASKKAKLEAPKRLAQYQSWAKTWPDVEYYQSRAKCSLEEVTEEIKREYLSTYIGSAIKSKGLLALTHAARGVSAVQLIQDYLKNHYTRTHQVKALLTALAYNDDPVAIQQVLAVSRRYRTASIQELAKTLVGEIAERHGWSKEELADRTIPTAGFGDDGVLVLEYGSRKLTALIDDKDKFVLKNEDGKIIKSLPAPRLTDDSALIKEAKSLFATAKKEYKQVLTMQTSRLYEAMCGERTWTVDDWTEYLYNHPLMKRLIARLVWLELDADGMVIQSFRPSDDGALLNLDDDEITLSDDSHIKLAHRVLIDDETADAWLAHFKDYKLKFLFAQMVNTAPEYQSDADRFDDKKGYLTDTYTLRGVVTKMGYQRASVEDGGSFDRYYKHHDALGLSVAITFSGSYVPEENIPAVVHELVFEKDRASTWNDDYLTLADIPPVLLAESYADYVRLANATQGFDPDWESKGLW